MKELKSSKNKIQEICDLLKRDTLEPARQQADRLIQDAEKKAKKIVEEAQHQAQFVIDNAKKEAQREQEVFQGNLKQAAQQAVESLKQAVEENLFKTALKDEIQKKLNDSETLAKLILALVGAVEKEGLDASIEVLVPRECQQSQVSALIGQQLLDKLASKTLSLGDHSGGIKLALKGKNMTLEMTDTALLDVLMQFVRKDFRNLFFK